MAGGSYEYFSTTTITVAAGTCTGTGARAELPRCEARGITATDMDVARSAFTLGRWRSWQKLVAILDACV
ncbi:hypothetical protein [Oryza sativa Japonica Group]|uniref:Uncharacterized protein n=1 Tax=Oryza sativa subsp. japonica TaxID=39947 RepID=Q5JLR3_ORYSJ|nr:hypothetical protein [Oryza sativa Japonica Group]